MAARHQPLPSRLLIRCSTRIVPSCSFPSISMLGMLDCSHDVSQGAKTAHELRRELPSTSPRPPSHRLVKVLPPVRFQPSALSLRSCSSGLSANSRPDLPPQSHPSMWRLTWRICACCPAKAVSASFSGRVSFSRSTCLKRTPSASPILPNCLSLLPTSSRIACFTSGCAIWPSRSR
jgi:hypothetical protein